MEKSAYLKGCSGGPGVPPDPGILGLRVRNLITLKTRKSDVEIQILAEREVQTYHIHEGEGPAVHSC